MKFNLMPKLLSVNKDELLMLSTHLSTVFGIMGLAASTVSLIDSMMLNKTGIHLSIPELFVVIIIVIFITIAASVFIVYLMRKRSLRKLEIATMLSGKKSHRVLDENEIKDVKDKIKEGTDHLSKDQKQCFNRIKLEDNGNIDYWNSSWLGAGNKNSSKDIGWCDKVQNIIIEENSGFWGKIPIINVLSNEGKNEQFLKLKFEHKKDGYWCAVIHGKSGHESNVMWRKNVINLSTPKYLEFYARTDEDIKYPKDKECEMDCLMVYIRIEDSQRVSSDGVVIRIKRSLEYYRIPISKFLIDPSLYEDYNEYVAQYVMKKGFCFNEKAAMQIMIGCSDVMPDQEGSILIKGLKFII